MHAERSGISKAWELCIKDNFLLGKIQTKAFFILSVRCMPTFRISHKNYDFSYDIMIFGPKLMILKGKNLMPFFVAVHDTQNAPDFFQK